MGWKMPLCILSAVLAPLARNQPTLTSRSKLDTFHQLQAASRISQSGTPCFQVCSPQSILQGPLRQYTPEASISLAMPPPLTKKPAAQDTKRECVALLNGRLIGINVQLSNANANALQFGLILCPLFFPTSVLSPLRDEFFCHLIMRWHDSACPTTPSVQQARRLRVSSLQPSCSA